METGRPWYGHLRISLRALLVLVVLIGGGLGWIARSAHIQKGAVAVIRRQGCYVFYDGEKQSGQATASAGRWIPNWLMELTGVDYFCNVVEVDFHGNAPESDAVMIAIGHLSRLETLNFDFSPMSGQFQDHRCRARTSERTDRA
jgi:hypothetical protein